MWNPDALCGGHLAKDRMQWCIDNCGLSEEAARERVMAEFSSSFSAELEWKPLAMCGEHRAEARATWLMSNAKLSAEAAEQRVMSEFPSVFKKAVDAWNPDVFCDGHSASARAAWLVDNQGMSLEEARRRVMQEFPELFSGSHVQTGGEAVAALGGVSAAASCLIAVPPSDPEMLVWADEFDYTGPPDPSKWTFDIGGHGWGNNELQHYTNRDLNAWVSDGCLQIRAVREDFEGKQYTSSRLLTKGKADWQYGRVEARALLPSGRGTWAAIWMLPSDNSYGTWPKSGEIDIMEHVGYDPGNVHGTVHTGAFNHMKSTQVGKVISAVLPEWHTYAVEWTKEGISFIMDGQQYHYFSNRSGTWDEWPFDHRFHILLNLAVGGDWGGQRGVDEEAFKPAQCMKVQW
eukprot:CAMPEP_0197660802 /NCGR_PEP_ID=MMETSP1338-20131121/51068_1 /TAXON_ID=43686 ORGANISM="Pelagodinium beii, Strain RCC1491" /NCGR_SAMPLE_ID=MMETSP1338 /ASSEMBLY_ACC=CAM_ASM_000754 /LENGTH=402 /DNA_ID=CAMNT_0043238229 /DNA_START=90 /DNA_END=1295 /DNA_ORIENTATION=-